MTTFNHSSAASLEELAIRPASFQDGLAIFNRIKAYPNELMPRPLSDIMLNIDRFLVAEDTHGELVGTISWSVLPELIHTKTPSVEIQSVSVREDWQRRKLGKMLVEAAIERIKVLQPEQIVVLTFTPDFFAKFGFRRIAKETIMHKLYLGCMNCTKYNSPFTCPEVAMALTINPSISHPPNPKETPRDD